MDVKNEQKNVIKIFFQLMKSAAGAVKLMHKTYIVKEWLRGLRIFHWHKAYSEGRETTALIPHVGQPLSVCTEDIVNTVATAV